MLVTSTPPTCGDRHSAFSLVAHRPSRHKDSVEAITSPTMLIPSPYAAYLWPPLLIPSGRSLPLSLPGARSESPPGSPETSSTPGDHGHGEPSSPGEPARIGRWPWLKSVWEEIRWRHADAAGIATSTTGEIASQDTDEK